MLLRAETTEDAEIAEAKTSTTWVVIQTRSVETFEMASTSNDRNRFRSNMKTNESSARTGSISL